MSNEILAAIDSFKSDWQVMIDRDLDATFGEDRLVKRELTVQFGKRYARFVAAGSAMGFVDLENGDILKAASWKAPAKHARGNVLRADRMRSVSTYGVNYLLR